MSIERRKLLKQAIKPWQATKQMFGQILDNTHMFVGAKMKNLDDTGWSGKSRTESRVKKLDD